MFTHKSEKDTLDEWRRDLPRPSNDQEGAESIYHECDGGVQVTDMDNINFDETDHQETAEQETVGERDEATNEDLEPNILEMCNDSVAVLNAGFCLIGEETGCKVRGKMA